MKDANRPEQQRLGRGCSLHSPSSRVTKSRSCENPFHKTQTSSRLMSDTAGKPITCKAMVARAPKEPLIEETITVAPPKAGEVRVKVMANALCHTVSGGSRVLVGTFSEQEMIATLLVLLGDGHTI